ncbi:DUF3349 domain-containing protein [Mycobacterium shigaense]|uniref:Uncharacterized protein n=1 Tax=Mycobacterium shigaense TaxID=722731 RepID=A0A1Z4EFC7_9MYCO|nr:DUF3349 domain-containing protein [Mycobacterium shigaense]MEA1122218.1 DUF3349 domain-containing protein [Mycobacterium shigaense]PRI16399.1 hypothetical protein B2J96_06350 [Mycobacterium shigaense]BAX91662.1 hypothetical protein MSG_01506 [Mycobacterium shigaense]
MSLSDVAARVLAFIHAGYPEGVPPTDYYPLLALLRHRLTEDEVSAIAAQLAPGDNSRVETGEIRTAITQLTDQVPSAEDLDRVRARLESAGWAADAV